MELKKGKKNKLIKGLVIGLAVCAVLITVGIIKILNTPIEEATIDGIEKSKISNLFNIKQATKKEETSASSSSTSRRTSSSSNTTNSTNTSTNTTNTTNTTRRNSYSSSTKKNTSSTSKNTQQATTTPSTQQTPPISDAPSTPVAQPPVSDTTVPSPAPVQKDENPPPSAPPTREEPPVEIPPVVDDTRKDEYNITITQSKDGHTYKAYQIFTGDLYIRDEEKILANIDWESKFDGDHILQELKAKAKDNFYNSCNSAADVADKLALDKEKDNDRIIEFAEIIGKIISDSSITPTKEVSDFKDEKYVMNGLNPGYYIVVDSYSSNNADDAYTRYLIDVVGNVEMEVKLSVPTLKKKILSNPIPNSILRNDLKDCCNTATYYAKDENIYDVEFELDVTLPSDIREYKYDDYNFTIVDVVDKGFDLELLEGKLKLTAESAGGTLESGRDYNVSILDSSQFDAVKGKYKLSDEDKEKKIIVIEFIDVMNKIRSADNELFSPGGKITLKYNARLNGEHKTGAEPNVNEAYLIYSDNPYKAGTTSKTVDSLTYTYSIELELDKVAANLEDTYLSDAEFKIYREDDDQLIDTIITGPKEIGTDEETGDPITREGFASYKSLQAGTYYIEETKAPDGYNLLKEKIKLEIGVKAVDDINKATWNDINIDTDFVKGVINDNIIKLTVADKAGMSLPETGGIGTIIFTVIGLSLMGLAVIAMKPNKKND